jgi:hypothetical protein
MSTAVAVAAASTLAARSMTTFATDRANTVHHVVKACRELCKLGV